MKIISGNRVKVLTEPAEVMEEKINEFLKEFDSKGDNDIVHYVSLFPMGGNRVLIYYPIFKEV